MDISDGRRSGMVGARRGAGEGWIVVTASSGMGRRMGHGRADGRGRDLSLQVFFLGHLSLQVGLGGLGRKERSVLYGFRGLVGSGLPPDMGF